MDLSPPVNPDTPAAADANSVSIQRALDAAEPGQTVRLPVAGSIWCDPAPVVPSGVHLCGLGPETILRAPGNGPYPGNCTLCVAVPPVGSYADNVHTAPGDDTLDVSAAADPALWQPGGVAYWFPFQSGRTRLPNIRRRILARDGDKVLLDGPADDPALMAKVFRRAAYVRWGVAVGMSGVQLDDPGKAAMFQPGDVAFLTDGTAINEAYGEYVTVARVAPQTGVVQFAAPLRRAFAAGLTSLVAGPWTTGVTISDLTIGANRPGNTTLFAKFAVDLNLTAVTVAGEQLGETMLCNCFRPKILHGNMPDNELRISTSQDAEVIGGTYRALTGEEYGLACHYRDLTCGGFTFNIIAEQYTFDRVLFARASGVQFYRNFRVTDCRQTNTPADSYNLIRGSYLKMTNFQSDAAWWVQPGTAGEGMEGEPKGPQNVQIMDSALGSIVLGQGTTGIMVRTRGYCADQSGGGWHFFPPR